MKRALRTMLAVALFPALAALAACESQAPPPAEDQSIRPARIFSVGADVSTLQYQFVAEVEAAQTVDMSFRIPGPLIELPVLEGQSLKAGDPVAVIDDRDYALALREAQVQREVAISDYTRKHQLLNDRGISQAVVDAALAQLELRKVAIDIAEENLERTTLKAPFDAYVAQRFTDNHVNIDPGEPIVRLMDLSQLFVVANVPEDLLATATPDRVRSIQAAFAFAPEQRFDLTFRENRGESHAVAQTFRVTFAMPRPEGWNILPGMTATVFLELEPPLAQTSLRIPTAALLSDPNKNHFVWKFDPDSGAVSQQAVEIGPATEEGIHVIAGLAPGDLIVASGAGHLQSGMRVRALGTPESGL